MPLLLADFIYSRDCKLNLRKNVDTTKEKRLQKRNAEIVAWENKRIDKRICPLCGAKLIKRCSRYGCFLGCENYPRCTFMTYRDVKTGKRKMKV